MITLLILIFFSIAILSVGLESFYRSLSLGELKHRGHGGDAKATLLYETVRNIMYVSVFLWVTTVVSYVFLSVFIARKYDIVTSVALLCGVTLLAVFVRSRPKVFGILAARLAVYSPRLVSLTRPYARVVKKIFPNQKASLYSREDMTGELRAARSRTTDKQVKQEISVAIQSLALSELKVAELMIPWSKATVLKRDDKIGTVLLNELHESGLIRFPVVDSLDNPVVVGTLFLKDVVQRRASGSVNDYMNEDFLLINDDITVLAALREMHSAKHYLATVKNESQDFVGILPIEKIHTFLLKKS
jgi:CBS domain containing-hemolysin-like protein